MTTNDEASARATKLESQDKILQREAVFNAHRTNAEGLTRGLLSHDPNPLRSYDADPLTGLARADRTLYRPGQFDLTPRSWQYLYEANDGTGRLKLAVTLMERSVEEVVVATSAGNPNQLSSSFSVPQTRRRRPDLDKLTAICNPAASAWIRDQDYKFLLAPPDSVFGPRLAEFPAYRSALQALPVIPPNLRTGIHLVEYRSLDWNTVFRSLKLAAEHGAKHRNTGAAVLIDVMGRLGLRLHPGVPLRIQLLEVIVPYEEMMTKVERMVGALPRGVASADDAGLGAWEAMRSAHRDNASILPHVRSTETFFRKPHSWYWLEAEIVATDVGDLGFAVAPRVRAPGGSWTSKAELRDAIANNQTLKEETRVDLLRQVERISEAESSRLDAYRERIRPIAKELELAGKSMHSVLPNLLKPYIHLPRLK